MSKFPTHGQFDGQTVADRDGVVWKYDKKSDTWINRGVLHNPPIVSDGEDGLVTPEIYRKLKLLESLKNKGFDFSYFKIATSNNDAPYFYYFNSSDDLIKFIPESQNKLRIEVDKARLAQKLLRNCCIGPVGPIGDAGEDGIDGKSAEPEKKQYPISIGTGTGTGTGTNVGTGTGTDVGTDNTVRFETTVETPLNTDISIRFFNNADEQLVEFIVSLNGNIVAETPENVVLNLTSINLEHTITSGVINGEFSIESNHKVSYFKARQRGPKGNSGKDGTGFLEIVNQYFDDDSVNAEEALITVRRSGVSNNILFTKVPIFSKVVVSSLSGAPNLPIDNLSNAKYVGLKITTDDCKDIGSSVINLGELSVPELDLAEWTPHCGCVDTFRYNISQLDWFKKTSDIVPFKFAIEPAPPESCCQEDFYYCPNAGDLCTIAGSGPSAPKRLPIKNDGDRRRRGTSSGSVDIGDSSGSPGPGPGGGFLPCPIYDPNEIELQGDGIQLPSIINQGSVETVSVVKDRGIGKSDNYIIDISMASSRQAFAIVVDLEIGNSDGSFEGNQPFSNVAAIENPFEVPPALPSIDNPTSGETCPIHTTMVLTREDGFLSELNPGTIQDMRHYTYITKENRIERRSFTGTTATGSGADLQLKILVNDFGSFDCCLPYALRITTVSEIIVDDEQDDIPATSFDGDGDSFVGPPSSTPLPNSPITEPSAVEPELEIVNPPVSINEPTPFVSAQNLDVPVRSNLPYSLRNEPSISTIFNAKLDGMYTVSTSRNNITINGATFTDRIIINMIQDDNLSVIEPFSALDPAMQDVLINNTTELVFSKDAAFLEDGPLGTGFYFLQMMPFYTESRVNAIKTKFRTDEYDGGFMFVSGSSLEEKSSNLIIVSNLVSWTVNRLNQNIIGYGSQWINTVNQGVKVPGDGLFQVILSESNLLQKLFGDFKVDVSSTAFITAIYNPFGCAEINIPETINSMVGAVVGGRNEVECDPPSPILPPPKKPQNASVQFVASGASVASGSGNYSIGVVLTTSNNKVLQYPVVIDVSDTLSGTGDGSQHYQFTQSTIAFPIGTPPGTVQYVNIAVPLVLNDTTRTAILELSSLSNNTTADDTFTLEILNHEFEISWDGSDGGGSIGASITPITATIITFSGVNLLYDVDLEVSWEESPGFFKGFDWDFLPLDPNTLLFAQNAISGSGVVFDLIYNNLNPGTVEIVIDNPEFTGVAAIYLFLAS